MGYIFNEGILLALFNTKKNTIEPELKFLAITLAY
jgi:hypothetical protein